MSSYIKRKIIIKLALDGDTFDGSSNAVTLEGLRTNVEIQSYSGSIGSFMSQASVNIKGMRNSDMNKLSTLGFSAGTYNKNALLIYAGDDINGMTLLFQGGITYGNVDYNAMPDVSVDLIASATVDAKFTAAAANSFKGSMNVASMIQGIAEAAGYGFQNAGVTAKLSNHATAGDALTQIQEICRAAGIHGSAENKVITIWPAGGTKDDTVIKVDPVNGLVGYPMYSINGVNIRTIFNPQMEVGRTVIIGTSTPDASTSAPFASTMKSPFVSGQGTFYVWGVTHTLSSEEYNGPWFSDVSLGNNKYNAH